MRRRRQILLCLLAAAATASLFAPWRSQHLAAPAMHVDPPVSRITYTDMLHEVESGRVKRAVIDGSTLLAVRKDNVYVETTMPRDAGMTADLVSHNVEISVVSTASRQLSFTDNLVDIGMRGLMFLFVIVVGLMLTTRLQRRGGMLGMGKSKAKLFKPGQPGSITFADVAGATEAKEELREIIDFLRAPEKFAARGLETPSGALLIGPPGTGKTMLVKAVAGEAGVAFYSLSGSDFVEMFVGVGSARVRDMFEVAAKNKPCIIFIDEIDAIGAKRGSGGVGGGGTEERERTLNELLVRMDGFNSSDGIVVIAATNRADMLDSALLRRFDRQIHVPLPSLYEREAIFAIHLAKRDQTVASDVTPLSLARTVPGFSGDDIQRLVNEASILSHRAGRNVVEARDFDMARDRITMGTERTSMHRAMSREELLRTARHEAGHALLATMLPECDPVRKVTIIPRGGALGFVLSFPDDDVHSKTRTKLNQEIIMFLGGRAAEAMCYGEGNVANGASADIRMATRQARRMAAEWGMSETLAPIFYAHPNAAYGADAEFAVSDRTARAVDLEVEREVRQALSVASAILRDHQPTFAALVDELVRHETLTGDEVRALVARMSNAAAGSASHPPAARNDNQASQETSA